jgi:mannose-1-phosphate guanylyltransferase/mannose-6-phosphate isomerase
MTKIIPAVMSGGAGTRLWPLSTEDHPKQFHALMGDQSLFTQTLQRVSGNVGGLSFAAPIALCNVRHLDQVRAHLGGATASAIVLEPKPRNTAAVGAIAATIAAEIDPDALVLLLPSDHVITDTAGFHAALARAAPFARDRIVTFGITPDRPATGYGYIKRGEELGDGVFAIGSFREKPNEPTAREYLAAGGYSWNAGIFLFNPRTMLKEFDASADVRDQALVSLSKATRRNEEIHLDAATFAETPSVALDIAVMEKTKHAAVAPCDIGWADIGSWDEVWRLTPRGGHGFRILGPAAAADASKMEAAGVHTIVVDGEDLVVVSAPQGLMIVPREAAQNANMLRDLAGSL